MTPAERRPLAPGACVAGEGRRAHYQQLQATRDGLLDERRAAAAALKLEKEARAEMERREALRTLEESRDRVDRIREATSEDRVSAAQEQFYEAR